MGEMLCHQIFIISFQSNISVISANIVRERQYPDCRVVMSTHWQLGVAVGSSNDSYPVLKSGVNHISCVCEGPHSYRPSWGRKSWLRATGLFLVILKTFCFSSKRQRTEEDLPRYCRKVLDCISVSTLEGMKLDCWQCCGTTAHHYLGWQMKCEKHFWQYATANET